MIKVESVEQLYNLASLRRSVVTWHGGRMPAAFVMAMPGNVIVRYIQYGLYVYQKPWRKPLALLEMGKMEGYVEVRRKGDEHYHWSPRMFAIDEDVFGYVYLSTGYSVHRDKLERVYNEP